jgi:streptogramin lyase
MLNETSHPVAVALKRRSTSSPSRLLAAAPVFVHSAFLPPMLSSGCRTEPSHEKSTAFPV